MNNVTPVNEKVLSKAFKIDEKEIKSHLSGLVKETVEETLNSLLSEEADAICGAERYQRSPDRVDTRAGKYQRKLLTGVGELELQVVSVILRTFDIPIDYGLTYDGKFPIHDQTFPWWLLGI
jgi:transposase-like protein